MKKSRIREAFSYLKDSRNYIFLGVGLFLLAGIIAFFVPSMFTFFDPLLKKLYEGIEGLSPIELIWFIFKNNVSSAFSALIFGVVFGIIPVINAVTNGALIGYVFSRVSAQQGLLSFWKLLPHGVFELPAIFISIGLGIKLGMFIFEKDKKKAFVSRVVNSMIIFLVVVIPLLVIAAIIEGLLIAFTK